MIRAMGFDLDGTLLDGAKRVPPSALAALHRCRERGVRLFVATARPPLLEKMLDWAEAAPLFEGGTFCNGACTVVGGEKAYETIPADVVGAVAERARRWEGLNFSLQMTGEVQAFHRPLDGFAYARWGLSPDEAAPVDGRCLNRTVKILIFYENLIDSVTALPEALVSELRALCAGRARMYVTDGGKLVQIASSAASKFAGVERIQRRLGLSPDEIAVFGDDVNDLEMLRGFRHSVAMAGAPETVRAAAEFVTDSCDGDGLARAIDRLLEIP